MQWTELPWSAVVALCGLLIAVFMLAMDERNRRKFATREDLNGATDRLDKRMDQKRMMIDRNANLYVNLDDRLGHLEEKALILEERQLQQWERIGEQMASTAKSIESVAARLEKISEMQQAQALRLERLQRDSNST